MKDQNAIINLSIRPNVFMKISSSFPSRTTCISSRSNGMIYSSSQLAVEVLVIVSILAYAEEPSALGKPKPSSELIS